LAFEHWKRLQATLQLAQVVVCDRVQLERALVLVTEALTLVEDVTRQLYRDTLAAYELRLATHLKPFTSADFGYNAMIAWDTMHFEETNVGLVELPDGSRQFIERFTEDGKVCYRMPTPTGDAVFQGFRELMEKGLGLTATSKT
jgi:hypothetical protein